MRYHSIIVRTERIVSRGEGELCEHLCATQSVNMSIARSRRVKLNVQLKEGVRHGNGYREAQQMHVNT